MPTDLSQGGGCGTVYRRCDFMARSVRTTNRSAKPIVVLVFCGVPAIQGEVDPAAERKHIVDEHELLVMSGGWACAPPYLRLL